MINIFQLGKKHFYLLFVFLLLWVILFEFILSPNQILPRPTIVITSIIALFEDYQFLNNLISSISAVYISFLAASFFLWIIKSYLINNQKLFSLVAISLKGIYGIIPGIFWGLFLIYWFPDSELIKYIFIFFTSFLYLFIKLELEIKKVNIEFIDSAISLGCEKNFVSSKVYWKAVEPALALSLTDLHLYLWTIIIVFELIKGGLGVGSVLRSTIQYKDLSAMFISVIFICIIIFMGSFIIKHIKNKYFSWSIS
jgi:ABC-type nitrate/sulfonate/bicarbonate transport system permease component